MRIAFAGPGEPRLSGGMIMVILIGNAMVDMGVDVEFVAEEEPQGWAGVRIPHRRGSISNPDDLRGLDAVITGWFGVRDALRAGVPTVAHFCAGYEPHLWPSQRGKLERIYRLPSLKLVIAPHIQRTLRREVGVDSTVIGAPIELGPFTSTGRERRAEGRPLRVLTVGPEPEGGYAPVPFKGIRNVLEIVRRVREHGTELELVRLTPYEDDLAASDMIDELHVAVPPAGVPEIYRSCDVYLGASTAAEGLGMPAIEAACSGLALALPEIPSFLDTPELEPSALFYPAGDLDAATERLGRLIDDAGLLRRLGAARGREGLVERFSPDRVAARTVEAIESAAG